MLFQRPVRSKDEDLLIRCHHRKPAVSSSDRFCHQTFRKGDRGGQHRGGVSIRHAGDKQPNHGYDTNDHGDHQHHYQPLKKAQAGRQVRRGVRSVLHGDAF